MAKSYSSRELIKMVKSDGWSLVTGDHHHFKHPVKPGRVTIVHPVKDARRGTTQSIFKQAGLK